MHFSGTPTPPSQYWIGENVDYEGLWNAYESGQGYVDKFRSMKVHLLRLTLQQQPRELPLFNFEVVYKTIKGYFHDLKKLCLTPEEYDAAGPLFIYRVGRSSGVWDFLGELRQILMLGTSLADEKVMGEKLTNMDRRMELLRKHFGNTVSPHDFQMFMNAKTPRQLDQAAKKLIKQGIKKVEISRDPFVGDIAAAEATLIDIKELPGSEGK